MRGESTHVTLSAAGGAAADGSVASMTRKIILDCDPGHDDAVALLLAHANPEIELLAVTTVGGNQTLDKVTRNALGVLTLLGATDVPVSAGCTRPLLREVVVAADIHGESGLDGVDLPDPGSPGHVALDGRHAVDAIIETVMAHEPGEVTLVPTGPLTNIALALRKEPRIVERVREVVLMGGGYHAGNASPVAEFNVIVDPEAASIVIGAGWPVVMVGLDLTHQALATADVAERVAEIDSAPARFVGQLIEAFGRAYREVAGFDAPPVHDPCTLAYLIDPSLVHVRRAPITVELRGEFTTGMTVVDLRGDEPQECPTAVATTLDVDGFWDLVIDAVERVGRS